MQFLHADDLSNCVYLSLNINEKKISIKGKTSESIGFIGRKEGIAAIVSTAIQIKNTDL